MVVLPAMPTCADEHHVAADADAVRHLHQVVDLRARLDPRFADGRAIDGRVGANLDVVLDDDRRDLRESSGYVPSGLGANPKPSLPMTAPFWMMTRLPMRQRSRIDTCAWMTQSSPIDDAGIDDRVRMHDGARPDRRARAHRREGADVAARGRWWRRDRHGPPATRPGPADRPAPAGRLPPRRPGTGSRARSVAQGAGAASSPTNDRRRPGWSPAASVYLGLARKDTSPGPAASSVGNAPDLDRAVAFKPAPETLSKFAEGQAARVYHGPARAIRAMKRSRWRRFRREATSRASAAWSAGVMPGRRRNSASGPDAAYCPGDVPEPVARAQPREEMPDGPEREVQRQHVRPGNGRQRQRRQIDAGVHEHPEQMTPAVARGVRCAPTARRRPPACRRDGAR